MRPLARLGITPNTLTIVGLVLSMVTAVVIAQGYLLVGGLLVLFAGIFDMFDGALARARNAPSIFGAFLDSTFDRYSESIILFGLFWYALQARTLHENLWPFQHEQFWMLSSIYIAVVGSLMVSYAKARAEGLGLECKTGLLARPERVVILAIGLITGTVIWAVLLLAIFSNFTAVERVVHIWQVTKHPEAVGQPDDLLAGKQSSTEAEAQFVASADLPEPTNTNEGNEPSNHKPVHTSVPPFNRSVQQE
ncbi:MAG TPA: CDP-alcohol phosphatidyltransferase family protein [Ktedonobacteraceae bacterium]|nr:CDP-alcohol phosphatidyltransferase family protein [Ktedonobacteraceae bacterium]